jgi:hypothetical protein
LNVFTSKSGKYDIGSNYCVDIYNYLKNGKKRYDSMDSLEIKPGYSFYSLDRLENIQPDEILTRRERDEIFQIYEEVYKDLYSKDKQNLKDFYVWMVNNNCFLTKELINKFSKIFTTNNPFNMDYYTLDPILYLYNKGLINELVTLRKSEYKDIKIRQLSENKNRYRLNIGKNERVP